MSEPVHPVNKRTDFILKSSQDALFQGRVISVDLNSLSKSDHSLERSFLDHLSENFQRQDSPAFSADAKPKQYLLNDFLMAGRNLADLVGLNQDAQDVLGEAGGEGLIGTGFSGWVQGKEEERVALRALDLKAKERAEETQRLGKADVALGVATVVSRSTGLATDTRGINSSVTATTSLGQATFALGAIGGACSAFWYGLIGLTAWKSLNELLALEKEITGKTPDEVLKIFREKLDFGPLKTLKVLREQYGSEQLEEPFEEWCENILSQETENLAKDFLQTINPDAHAEYDFEAAAKKMTGSLQGVTVNGENGEIGGLNLSQKALIGLESLHRNRLEMAKADLSRTIGGDALLEVLDLLNKKDPKDAEKTLMLQSVEKGLSQARTENRVLLAFGFFGVAIVVASTIGACIACPPLGLIIACAVCSVFLAGIGVWVDWSSLLKLGDAPIGKFEERANTLKLLMGIGCIVGICLLSAGSLGTFPVALSLVVVSSIVITSLFRYVHASQKRASEKEIEISMQDLLLKLKSNQTDSSLDVETKKKIKMILEKKLERTHKVVLTKVEGSGSLASSEDSSLTPEIILADSLLGEELGEEGGPLTEKETPWSKRIVTYLEKNQIADLEGEIEKWQAAEELVVGELRDAFRTLGVISSTSISWVESFKQIFLDVPHLKRIFPEVKSKV